MGNYYMRTTRWYFLFASPGLRLCKHCMRGKTNSAGFDIIFSIATISSGGRVGLWTCVFSDKNERRRGIPRNDSRVEQNRIKNF